MIPISGSAYTYGYATLGEFVAWIIGWDLILEYLFAASTVAVGWSGYIVSFLKDLGLVIPPAFTSAPYNHAAPADAGWNIWRLFTEGWTSTGAVLNVPRHGDCGHYHHPASGWHQGVRQLQQHHRGHQTRSDPGVHCRRGGLYQPRKTGSPLSRPP